MRGVSFKSDHRISYWRKGLPSQNFGDLLSEPLFGALRTGKGKTRPVGDFDVIHLIGSVISDWHIERGLEHVRVAEGRRIAFWGCGLRSDAPLQADLVAHCSFFGVRGPLSRQGLRLPEDTPLGDPGLLMPLIHEPKVRPKSSGRVICIPHFLDTKSDAELLDMTGADLVVRPGIKASPAELFAILDAIAGAKLVLAGALHAAIMACAYKTPFAYLDTGFVDVPFKWSDFAASVNMPCRFVKTAAEGHMLFDRHIAPALKLPPLAPLLAVAPLKPTRDFLRRVKAYDNRH